jgi:serine/threonine protein phosphatase PrpC
MIAAVIEPGTPLSAALGLAGGSESASGLTCGEVRGGCRVAHDEIELPGLRGVLYSRPCAGAHGGDIHYLSVCGSGFISRLCLADVAGHGDAVAAVSAQTYDQLRRSVDTIDNRRVLRGLDRRLARSEIRAMTTAVMATYFPPSRRLTVSYAGHPEAWLYSQAEGRWRPIEAEPAPPRAGFVGLPLGTDLAPSFTRRRLKVDMGDRLLLITDGVLEATSPDGVEFGHDGLARVLAQHDADIQSVMDRLLGALVAHTGEPDFSHDDVTVFVGEFVEGPPGSALWHALKNRLGMGPAFVAGIRSRRAPAESVGASIPA